ncbi:MAG: ribosome biogenesis GTP-binding protein YihA/YsxC [Gemmatimonadaceae bacterium]|nr:ribosome biogenesis GTP-binding protein YihA/YsxC [Gemmatimonadaceae bacterium]
MTDSDAPPHTNDGPRADPLVIRSLEFDGPMASVDGWRPEPRLPEIAFAGRSNVGKSSLLNSLVRRKAFARVSRTPGRTREINFFRVNNQFMLVDLPGYGYAKISKDRKAAWKPLIASYMRNSPYLRGVVQLLDVRHDPTEDDRVMLDFLADVGVPTLVALTKVDKLGPVARAKRITALCEAYGVDEEQVIPFSAHAHIGRDELADALVSLLDAGPWREEPVYVPRAEGETAPSAVAESAAFDDADDGDDDETIGVDDVGDDPPGAGR